MNYFLLDIGHSSDFCFHYAFRQMFSAVFRKINLNMLFVNQHVTAKWVDMFIRKKRHTTARPRFYESGIPDS